MAAKLGGTFLVGASGPVNYAGQCILSSRVTDGLRELTPDSLYGGFRRGVEESAKRVGVGSADVERLLPMDQVRSLVNRLTVSQRNAVQAWDLHAGHMGGFLKGVADLTADGRAPDVGLCLERLAKKVTRDRELAEPLRALAVDVGAWQDLISRCRDLLDDGGALERAYRMRRVRRVLAIAGLAGIIVGALAVVLWVRAARGRVDEVLASADACAVSAIDPGDARRASSDQRRRLAARDEDCTTRRANEAKALEIAHAREEKAREELRVKKELEQTCEALAAHLDAGSLTPDDAAFAGARAALLRRIAQKALDAADFGPADPDLPCAGTEAAGRISAAFTRAILAAPARWANADDPSKLVTATLIEHVADLPSSAKQVVARRADDLAKKALIIGVPGLLPRAVRLCQLKVALGIRGGSYCAGALFTIAK
jgi:hypothetical protein